MSVLDEVKSSKIVDSDSDDTDDENSDTPELTGNLQKWTNYIHGWQDRYFVLKDGCLSYFKERAEIATGSRGSFSLAKATVKEHEFDELRFDIGVNDSIWYCRAKDREERKIWLDAIELHKSGSDIDSALSRNGSMFSLNSISSGNLISNFKNKNNRAQELKSITSEIETLRNLSLQLVNNIESHIQTNLEPKNEESIKDFDLSALRADSLTFKATTAHLLDLCQQCVEISVTQDEKLRSRLERELERRRKFEELYKSLLSERVSRNRHLTDGPDFQEGPHSALTDEMWFDAVDSAIDKLDESALKQEPNTNFSVVKIPQSIGAQRTHHKFSDMCDNYVKENLKYAFTCGNQLDGWELMHCEGEMKVYRKEVEIDGVVVDPLKATHQVEGVTAQEMCRWFFDPDFKMEWEGHVLERVKVLEILAPDTVIIHSIMKRMWPSAQRDMVYLSHIRHVSAHEMDNDQNDTWIVCNYSVEHEEGVLGRGVVRCNIRSSMVCQTIIKGDSNQSSENLTEDGRIKLPRDQVSCKVWYTADVNPGGWAPAKVLRQIYKHEYPKFLLKFGSYVHSKSAPVEPEALVSTTLQTSQTTSPS